MTSEFSRYRRKSSARYIGGFNFQKNHYSKFGGKNENHLILSIASMLFKANNMVTRFDLMRISIDLGNQQQQIGTVGKCKKKEQTNHANRNAWMLTSVEFKETCVCTGPANMA